MAAPGIPHSLSPPPPCPFPFGTLFAVSVLLCGPRFAHSTRGLDLCAVPHITLPQTRVVTCAPFFHCVRDLGLAAPISLVLSPGFSYSSLPSYSLSFCLLRATSCLVCLMTSGVPRARVALCYSFGRPHSHCSVFRGFSSPIRPPALTCLDPRTSCDKRSMVHVLPCLCSS